MQTLQQAIHLLRSGNSASLSRAAGYMIGCPVGGWGETLQARRKVMDELPFMFDRSYTIEEFIQAVYKIDHAGRYQSAFSEV